ncbi:DUF3533 domain-containing protein [Streptomyces sp. BR1]|uniref:DUF3533 domain-containing protein n=1 Tax=Streptomyces sp. BR1 TaxID=1592323 RepID=UPI00402B7EFE
MTFLDEVKNAVTVRAALLVIGVLGLMVAFITSYAGAFHSPKPKDVAFGVVAPPPISAQAVQRLNAVPGGALDARAVADRAAAVKKLRERDLDAALIVDPASTTDTLLVASGGGASLSGAVELVMTAIEKAEQRTLKVEDVAPADPKDTRGLSSFYLIVGWCVGGYLCAAILAISHGARPANTQRAVIRLAALAVYAIAAGLLGALIIGPVLGALPGSYLGLAGLGALVVFAVGATTLAFQGLAGIVGIGLAILVIVVLGNPSAGGAYPYPLLPPFWKAIGPALPPGAGTWTARSIAYFRGNAVTGPLLVLSAWAVGGALVTMVMAVLRQRGEHPEDEALEVGART